MGTFPRTMTSAFLVRIVMAMICRCLQFLVSLSGLARAQANLAIRNTESRAGLHTRHCITAFDVDATAGYYYIACGPIVDSSPRPLFLFFSGHVMSEVSDVTLAIGSFYFAASTLRGPEIG